MRVDLTWLILYFGCNRKIILFISDVICALTKIIRSLLNFNYKGRHFKTHDLRKSRLTELYARGYPKESIVKFATHSSE